MPSKFTREGRDLAKKIGASLLAARRSAGLSQRQVGESMGMTRENYARLERGGTNVTIESLIRAADALGLTVSVEFHPAVPK